MTAKLPLNAAAVRVSSSPGRGRAGPGPELQQRRGNSASFVHNSTGSKLANQGVLKNARRQVRRAIKLVQCMERDPQLKAALAKPHRAYIVPNYSKGALIVGGGRGVLLIHNASGTRSNPSFYNIAAISLGALAGASAGSVAFLLMTSHVVKHFMSSSNFSLNAGAGPSWIRPFCAGQGIGARRVPPLNAAGCRAIMIG